jgi:putative chitinase
MITFDQLKGICPDSNSNNIVKYLPWLNNNFDGFEINTLLRKRHFIAQVCQESGQFLYVKELASGRAYEGRKDLGNINVGDGMKYKGRGLIQITGRINYAMLSDFLFKDNRLLSTPELLESPEYAVKSAMWYWQSHGLNKVADMDDITLITRKINGGLTAIDNRINYYNKTKVYII